MSFDAKYIWQQLAALTAASNIQRQEIVGNGSNTIFTMTTTPTDINSLQVYVNGLMLVLTDDYTISGNNITILITPLTTDKISIIYY